MQCYSFTPLPPYSGRSCHRLFPHLLVIATAALVKRSQKPWPHVTQGTELVLRWRRSPTCEGSAPAAIAIFRLCGPAMARTATVEDVCVCVCEGWGRWQSTQTIFNIYFLFALSITIFPPHHSHHMVVPIQPGNYNCARTPPPLLSIVMFTL